MFSLKSNRLFAFILEFAEKYHQAKSAMEQQTQAATLTIKYKINSTYEEYKKSGKLLIQARQGGSYSHMTPKAICADQHILSHLHPLDVSIVTKLYCEESDGQATCHITKQWTDSDDHQTYYQITDAASDDTLILSECQLANATHITNRLNAKDCMTIGFDLGIQHGKKISELKG